MPIIVRVQNGINGMMRIDRTVELIVAGKAPGFFTGSGILIPFSVDLSNFCRIFRR